MIEWIKGTIVLGILLWLFGYLISIALFFSPVASIMGWIITAIFTPVTVVVTWWWFRRRNLALTDYVLVGVLWTIIAVVFDYLFIVQLLRASYYGTDIFVYYILTFLIPIGVGLYLVQAHREHVVKQV